MADAIRSGDGDDQVRLTSDREILEIKEENTRPGKASARYRSWLEAKYRRKAPVSDGATDAQRTG
jgi:hypothetical protein